MRFIEGTGLVMFLIGAAGMDSESQLIPAVMALAGLGVFCLCTRLDME